MRAAAAWALVASSALAPSIRELVRRSPGPRQSGPARRPCRLRECPDRSFPEHVSTSRDKSPSRAAGAGGWRRRGRPSRQTALARRGCRGRADSGRGKRAPRAGLPASSSWSARRRNLSTVAILLRFVPERSGRDTATASTNSTTAIRNRARERLRRNCRNVFCAAQSTRPNRATASTIISSPARSCENLPGRLARGIFVKQSGQRDPHARWRKWPPVRRPPTAPTPPPAWRGSR